MKNLTCQIFIQHFFKIVLYWCLDLIRHNIGTPLKHNKYIFYIPIPFCHYLYLSATFKQCFTEFAGHETVRYVVYMWVPYQIPTKTFNDRQLFCGLKKLTLRSAICDIISFILERRQRLQYTSIRPMKKINRLELPPLIKVYFTFCCIYW